MPVYKRKEAILRIHAQKQLELLVRALQQAYDRAEPREKKIYSRLLKMLEK